MTEYKYDFVKIRVHDGIAWTALNRPEKRNAMSPALHYEMDDALARLEVDDNVKVVVVTGEGGNFSAGQDLKKFFRELEKDPAERKKAYEIVAKKFLAEGSILYLYHAQVLVALTDKVEGYKQIPDGLIRVVGVKLK